MPSPYWLMAPTGGSSGAPPSSLKQQQQERLQMCWQPHLIRRRTPLGLRNLGNTCYLNSVLQCLTYTPPLANFCLQFLHSSRCEKQLKPEKRGDCPFCVLERRIERSLNLDAACDAPSRINGCLRIYAAHFQWGHQEDAHEFLRYVIDACHSTLGGGATIVKDIFGGALLSQVNCLSCGCVSSKTDEIMDISLDLFQTKSLNDALRRFFLPELLDGDNKYSCGSCKKLSSARKHMFILQAPNVLVIQLKRFEGINGAKINKDISFQEVLLLSDFMSKASQDPKPEYNLFGSIVHSGYSPESGHYYAYVKDPSGHWYCCNDSTVSPSNTEEVLSEKVYILFYLRSNQASKSVTSILPSDGQNLAETNGKGHVGISEVSSIQKSSRGLMHPERNSLTGTKNGMVVTSSQIKFGLKSSQNSISSNGNVHAAISNDAKNGKGSSSKQLSVSANNNSLSTVIPSKNPSAINFQERPYRNDQAGTSSSSNSSLTRDYGTPIVSVTNLITSQEANMDYVNLKTASPKLLTVGSGNDCKECRLSGKDWGNNKRKVNVENSTNPSPSCSFSGIVREDASYISYSIFTEKLSPEGLQDLIEGISKKARAELKSCGWIDEVHNFMYAQKRLCIRAADQPPDNASLRKRLVADARETFTSKIPHELKEHLITCLRKSFCRGSK